MLSFDYAIQSSSTSSSSGANGQQQQGGQRLVVAGIEVGGVVVADADSDMAQWEERTTGLCPDVSSADCLVCWNMLCDFVVRLCCMSTVVGIIDLSAACNGVQMGMPLP